MSISSILNIAKNAILATQYSIQITANNISNANTEGYSRQSPVLEAQPSVKIGNAVLGNGVYLRTVIRYADRYFERQLAEKNTELKQNKVYQSYYERIESIISEENSKLSKTIIDFFNSWHELSLDPSSVAAREGVRSCGSNLSSLIKNLYTALFNLQIELEEKLKADIEDVNRLTREIADLNRRIFEGSSKASFDNDLMDKRQMLLRELSGKIKVNYFEDDFGMVTVLMRNGNLLVDGGKSYDLGFVEVGEQRFSNVAWKDQLGNLIDITSFLEGGELNAIIDLRDSVIKGVLAELDELARVLIWAVNDIHKKGYTLLGTQGVPFFKEIDSDFAKDITLSDEVKSDVRMIAASEDIDENNPVGAEIARRIASLSNAKMYAGKKATAVEFVASLNNKIGQLSRNAKELLDFSEATYSVMEKQRENISGVSLDEEILNLIKYQYAYQAASRLFNIADELFKSIIDAIR